MVPEYINFAQLHEIIQVIFGWENDHLHEFQFPKIGIRITGAEPFGNESMYENIRIKNLLGYVKWFYYIYDFGDNWVHKIEIEKEIEEYPYAYPQVEKYKGNNFQEDSGGVFASWEDELENSIQAAGRSEYSISDMNEYLQKIFNFKGERKAIIKNIDEIGTPEFKKLNICLEPETKSLKIYPNDPCVCGSGKKYKKCCGK